MTKKSEHDFTGYSLFGHNINILHWDRDRKTGRAACWITPGLREGDIVIVRSEQGSMRLVATEVRKAPNVDDMYLFEISVEDPEETKPEDEGQWVTKVRRNGGGTSILDVASTKAQAQALADEFNEQYQTDNYYIEKYDEALHAYSRHG